MSKEEIQKCPFCAEDIKKEAKVCKHCKSSLDETSSTQKNKQKKTSAFQLSKESNKPKEGLFLQSMNCGCAAIFIVIVIILLTIIAI